MAAESGHFRLRCELRGHEEDVRGICICGDSGIATGSRDKTVRFWSVDESEKRSYVLRKTMVGHSSFVGPLAWIPPSEHLPEGGLLSGGMDTLVIAWDLSTAQANQTLKGHQLQVTGVTLDDHGDILSSSIDCTVKRWRNGHVVESWQAHQAPIQAILKLPSGEIATGSTDQTLKIWRGSTCVHTFLGHTDTVRGLAVMPNLGILSASHDGCVRLWALSGETLLEMVGHSSIVYSVAAHSSGVVASGSEDRFAKLWRDAACFQSIEHPGCVWDVKFLPNGDLVTACSDGVIRMWTTDHERMAGPAEVEAFEAQLSSYKCNTKMVGGVKVSDLPGLEALQQPGSKNGQTKIVREGDSGVAYSWNMAEYKWDKIGEVVDGPDGSQGRKTLDGVPYDHVFDVDIGDGEPIRRLPYNRGDNPYYVAEQWLLKEGLPLTYREQVVEFILKNTGQSNVPLDNSFVDPYTGASAYVPGQTSPLMPSLTQKYSFKHIPKRGMLFFDMAQYDGILRKIAEFNSTLASDEGQRILSLNDGELLRVNAVVAVLKDSSHYHASTFADIDLNIVVKLLSSWPTQMLFPVLDFVKMMVLHPHGANLFIQIVQSGNDILMETIRRVSVVPALSSNQLTSIRLVVNCFKHSCFRTWLQSHRDEIIDLFSECCSSSNKNVQLSYSTLLLNYAVLLIESKDEEGQLQVLSAVMEMGEAQEKDVDIRFRALVAIGSLMHDGLVKQQAVQLDVESIAASAKASKEIKIAEVGADIEHLIRTI
uniref:Phospholipase A-2-activating protein n=1 Tax=Araucaria cunninghamii TaxID=56994 RepID=A0A0D6QXS4_ARACU